MDNVRPRVLVHGLTADTAVQAFNKAVPHGLARDNVVLFGMALLHSRMAFKVSSAPLTLATAGVPSQKAEQLTWDTRKPGFKPVRHSRHAPAQPYSYLLSIWRIARNRARLGGWGATVRRHKIAPNLPLIRL